MGMPNTEVQVSDLNEPIFAGPENINIINSIKIVNREDTVNYGALFNKFIFQILKY
jgi:hypothetical protein